MNHVGVETSNAVDVATGLNELIRGLRTIPYSSISLTVHNSRLVEIRQTEKIRRKA